MNRSGEKVNGSGEHYGSMNILGLSAYGDDSSACLVKQGEIIAAAQEGSFSRRKRDNSFPVNAIRYCLQQGNIDVVNLDLIAFYTKPLLKFERFLGTHLSCAPVGFRSFLKTMPLWVKQQLRIKSQIASETGFQGKIIFPECHEAHGASAFYPSPFLEAAFLTVDGVGEWASTSYGVGTESGTHILAEMRFPHSLGLLLSAFIEYLGFSIKTDEDKLMTLAPHGKPKYKNLILSELIDLKADGSFKLNMTYFDCCVGPALTNEKFSELFGRVPRTQGTEPTEMDLDIACSIQEVTEEIVVRMAEHVFYQTGRKNLCLAGSVFLNAAVNDRIFRESSFDNIWIQPASGEAGAALGAALFGWYQYGGNKKNALGKGDLQKGNYLGPEFNSQYIRDYLDRECIPYTEMSEDELPVIIAGRINDQQSIGWFQGRSEYGPMALGNRSILIDARSAKVRELDMLKLKGNQSSRPFSISVLAERVTDYFEQDLQSPYMLLTAPVFPGMQKLFVQQEGDGAVLNETGTNRSPLAKGMNSLEIPIQLQTVDGRYNPLYHALIKAFDKEYGCGFIAQTSFSCSGEPLVRTPEDAYKCYREMDLDCLVMGRFLIEI